jgi:hypothetical protein
MWRNRQGEKKSEADAKRGIVVLDGLAELANRCGYLLVAEGLTCTLSAFHAGLPCIARPMVNYGDKFVAAWVKENCPTVKIIVVGENDEKADGKWPGRDDAKLFAEKLAGLLGRFVMFALPPTGSKDLRAYLLQAEGEWKERGEALRFILDEHAEAIEAETPAWADRNRPKIYIGVDEDRFNAEVEAALGSLTDVFTGGGEIVHVVHPSGEPARILPVLGGLLQEKITTAADIVKLSRSEDGLIEEPAHPPGWSVKAISQRGNYGTIRPLLGIVEHPVLRADGSIASKYGYDPQTRLFIASRLDLAIPERLTQADAISGRELLYDLTGDFPFQDDTHRAAWLAMLLTMLARTAFVGLAPGYLIEANARGSGKGLLSNVAGTILLGQEFDVTTYSDENENRKKITASVRQGRRAIVWDNIVGKLGGGVIDAFLTTRWWEDRILGESKTGCWPNLVTMMFTANNAVVNEDTCRRLCFIRLETPHEKPEDRSDFRRPNLLQHIRDNREKYLAAAFAILRAYHLAGRPAQPMKAWGSFESWSALIRGAVIFSGGADPGETRVELQSKAGSSMEAAGIFAAALSDMCGEGQSSLTCKEIIGRLQSSEQFDGIEGKDVLAALETCMVEVTGRTLGNWLRQFDRRSVGGYVVRRSNTRAKAGGFRWTAERSGLVASGASAASLSLHPRTRGNDTPANVEGMEKHATDAAHATVSGGRQSEIDF